MKKFISILAILFVTFSAIAAETDNFVPFTIKEASKSWVVGSGDVALNYNASLGTIGNDTCMVVVLYTDKDLIFDEETHIVTRFFYGVKNLNVSSYLVESHKIEDGYRLIFKTNEDFNYEWNIFAQDIANGEIQGCNLIWSFKSINFVK